LYLADLADRNEIVV